MADTAEFRSVHPALRQLFRKQVEKAITTKKLAELSGYSEKHIFGLRHGLTRPSLQSFADLAQAAGLGIVIVDLDIAEAIWSRQNVQ